MEEALQLGVDWIWARIQELASLLRSLLAGASNPERVLVGWLCCRLCVMLFLRCLHLMPIACHDGCGAAAEHLASVTTHIALASAP